MLAVFLVFLILASSWLFTQRRWWMPELASLHGADIGRVFGVTLAISGILFILLQGVLAYLAFRYAGQGHERARYWIRPRLEKRFALVAGIIIFGVDVTIYALGESGWFKAWGPPPPGTPVIEVMGEQFVWNFRYAGPDGVFGRTDPTLISRQTHSASIRPIPPQKMTSSPSISSTFLKGSQSACVFVRTT
jgi:cytochrome c oxidase subunit 2